jgi:hypothetical protein
MSEKSGTYWVTWADAHAKNSSSMEDLESDFKAKAKAFIKALEDASAKVAVTATKRHENRAYLFHWCWKIAQDQVKASAVPAKIGVDIEWNHGDDAKSKAGAEAMVTGFGLAVPPDSNDPPALTSNHIAGRAIDMDITWTGKIKIKKQDGKEAEVEYKADVNSNTTLHEIGASYGVNKLTSDAPHWSYNGH